jgi:hypothetical protein
MRETRPHVGQHGSASRVGLRALSRHLLLEVRQHGATECAHEVGIWGHHR